MGRRCLPWIRPPRFCVRYGPVTSPAAAAPCGVTGAACRRATRRTTLASATDRSTAYGIPRALPPLRDWRAVLCDTVDEIAIYPASYVLGDRCPVIALRPRR